MNPAEPTSIGPASTLVMPSTAAERFQAGLERLDRLREFAGPEEQFWVLLVETATLLAGASLGLLFREAEDRSLQPVCTWPEPAPVQPGFCCFAGWRRRLPEQLPCGKRP